MAAIQTQVEDKVLAIITGMALDWPAAGEIARRRLPWDEQGDGTAIFHRGITIFPLKKAYGAGTNEREDVGYGVGIAIIKPADHATTANDDTVNTATEAIRRKIVEDRLTLPLIEDATYNQTKVRDLEVNVPKAKHRYEVSFLEVRCWVREPRT